MKTHLYLFWALLLCLAIILSACSSIITTQQSQTGQPPTTSTATTNATAATSKVDTTPTPISTSKASGLHYEKLDMLSSYKIVTISEALAGPAKGVIFQFDAKHLPGEKAYQATASSSRDGGEFKSMEECIVIGSNKWVKPYGKDWTTGDSIAGDYLIFINVLYLTLSKGTSEKIDETTVSGIPAVHYSIQYETKSTRMIGEVWIANQSGMQPVPLKASFEQMALDEKGAVIDDSRHSKTTFEVDEVNTTISIKAPI